MVAELALIILVATILVVLFGTKIGKRIRLRANGTADEMIAKDASTPEGAKAHYNNAIAKKEEDYRNAHALYAEMLGKIQTFEGQLRALKKEKMQASINVNECIERNDDDGARIYLKRQQEISEKESIISEALKELKENSRLQKEAVDAIFEELDELKAEKESNILALEMAQVTSSLKATPGLSNREEDQMLEKVREGVRKTKEKSDGNRIAYENSSEVQQQRLEKRMKESEIDKQLQELKAKRGK